MNLDGYAIERCMECAAGEEYSAQVSPVASLSCRAATAQSPRGPLMQDAGEFTGAFRLLRKCKVVL